ncbi:MAG: aldehyde ferredoxin oxidoreductase N-terminal domain-containing protein [Candidatus Cloacimonadales bacterium]
MNKHIMKMKEAHQLLAEFAFEPQDLEKGYANRSLRIDLSNGDISTQPITSEMKELWTGGKGFDLWLTLQEINENTKWDSPENPICFSSGPLGGTTSFPGSGKTIVTAISPLTDGIMDSNVGGYFGPFLKFSGFDALTLIGKSEKEVIVMIDSTQNKVQIYAAPLEGLNSHILAEELTEMYADDEIGKRNIAVVSAGEGARHTRMGVLNFSFYDWRRKVARLKQAGRGGIGTVLMDKKIKAILIKSHGISPAWSVQESKVASSVTPKNLPKCDCGSKIADICQKWQNNPEFVIEMLQDIQLQYRCIPENAIDIIQEKTGTPKAHLYHIATFYKSFSLEQKGEKIIQVCMGTACHVKGSGKILENLERILGIKSGETTADGKYSLEDVACLGACSIAPVMKIGDQVYGNVKSTDLKKLVAEAKESENE